MVDLVLKMMQIQEKDNRISTIERFAMEA